ncbi:hypothetical protein [Candidatus Binatus soli]|jgi:hypothetical protein|uniref:hypothetical protein n=1 Tax=Candidatus Binatus soli TaxID=1953413 RepID=UPI003D0DB6C4
MRANSAADRGLGAGSALNAGTHSSATGKFVLSWCLRAFVANVFEIIGGVMPVE